MAICLYNVHEAERREAARREYIEAEGFPALVSAAQERGYRKATNREINDSAECNPGAEELFCWRGGLWVKK